MMIYTSFILLKKYQNLIGIEFSKCIKQLVFFYTINTAKEYSPNLNSNIFLQVNELKYVKRLLEIDQIINKRYENLTKQIIKE